MERIPTSGLVIPGRIQPQDADPRRRMEPAESSGGSMPSLSCVVVEGIYSVIRLGVVRSQQTGEGDNEQGQF